MVTLTIIGPYIISSIISELIRDFGLAAIAATITDRPKAMQVRTDLLTLNFGL